MPGRKLCQRGLLRASSVLGPALRLSLEAAGLAGGRFCDVLASSPPVGVAVVPTGVVCAKTAPLESANNTAISSRLGMAGGTLDGREDPDYSAVAAALQGRFGDNRPMPAPAPLTPSSLAEGSRADAERDLLLRLAAGAVSGHQLAKALGVTRAAIWKRIDALRDAGIDIDARAGAGYLLAQPLDLLDAAAILARLDPVPRALLAELAVAWEVGSTNSVLLAQAAPLEGARVLLAERQTGGRGRLGRDWRSPLAANLYLSLDRHFSGGLARLPGLSLVAGIASAEALRAVTGLDIGLKWPNDLWLDGRKLGGLLVEGGGEHGAPARAVIGLGLNVRMPASHGSRIGQPWIDLAARLSMVPARNALAAALVSAWLPALQSFDRDGLTPFLSRWQALDVLAGRTIRVHAGQGAEEVEALGVSADGGLRVRDAAGERVLYAGEVSVRPHA